MYSVIQTLKTAHFSVVKQKIEKEGIDFCKMDRTNLYKIKKKYPLNIEFDLGKIERMKPSNIDEFEKHNKLQKSKAQKKRASYDAL